MLYATPLILRLTIPSFYCHSEVSFGGDGGIGSSSSDDDADLFAYADLLDLYSGRCTAEAAAAVDEEGHGEEGEVDLVYDEVCFMVVCKMNGLPYLRKHVFYAAYLLMRILLVSISTNAISLYRTKLATENKMKLVMKITKAMRTTTPATKSTSPPSFCANTTRNWRS